MIPAFLIEGPLHSYFGGESGILLAVIYGGVAWWSYRRTTSAAPEP